MATNHHVMAMKSMEIPETEPADSLTKLFARDENKFPPGLRLQFDDRVLETLGLDKSCSFGDMIHLFAMARVCSIHDNGICVQIESMAVEDENTENDEEDAQEGGERKMSKRYNASTSRYLDGE